LALRPLAFDPFRGQHPYFAVTGQLTVVNDLGTRFRVLASIVYCGLGQVSEVSLAPEILDSFALQLGAIHAYDFAQRQVRVLAALHERDHGLPLDYDDVSPRLLRARPA